MMDGLKKQTIAAVGWSAVDALLRQGLQFGISVILARLLAPEEFGAVAMVSIFVAVGGVFADGGFGSALIQKENPTRLDTSSVFYFNLTIGMLVALVLWLISPWIARFYRMPVLDQVTRFMALNLVINTFGSVHSVLLTKDLDFRTQTRIGAVAMVSSGVVAVVLAAKGFGVWCLVIQTLVASSLSVLLLWMWRPWRPLLAFSFGALRSLFRFGSFLFLSALLDTAYNRAYGMVIGKLYSARDLGYYSRADGTQQIPTMLLSRVVERVAFPLLSSVATNKELLYRGMQKGLVSTMFVNVPACLGLLAVSRPLVLTLFGEKWAPCIPYLQVLCLPGLLYPIHVINLSVLKSMGRSDLFFRVELVKKLLGILALVISSTISILVMAWSCVLLSVMGFVINSYYVGTLLGYSASRQIVDILPCVCAAGIMAFAVWGISLLLVNVPPPALLAMQVPVGIGVYILASWLLRIPVLSEALQQLQVWMKATRLRRGTP